MAISPDMKIRLPLALRKQIEEAASESRRSLNAEITARLEASFEDDRRSKMAAAKLLRMSPAGDDPMADAIADLESRLTALEKGKPWPKRKR